MRFGPSFQKPNKNVLRLHRAKTGKKLFTVAELRTLIDAAGVPLKAMILLGINCGFGNSDCGTLPFDTLDLKGGWVEFPRPKTGIPRRCPLWPETVQALRDAIAKRPQPKDEADAGLVFITMFGWAWAGNGKAEAVTLEMGKLQKKLGITRAGVGFYALRHTFHTIADATRDPNAIRLIMGHTDDRIDDNYTHGIDDARLRMVTEHVRKWLYESAAKTVESANAVSGTGAAQIRTPDAA